jgi:hypothetical protein
MLDKTNDDFPQDIRIFDDILSLIKHLEAEHDPNMHLYRGQINRFTHNWVDENGPITLESLYPSDYRFITKYNSPDELTFTDIPAARSYDRNVRDMFLAAMTLKAATGKPDWAWLKNDLEEFYERLAWLTEQRESGRSLEEIATKSTEDISLMSIRLTRVFWSLAQHYLIATALTDVTFSPRIAAWFATQPWDAREESPTNGKGVI